MRRSASAGPRSATFPSRRPGRRRSSSSTSTPRSGRSAPRRGRARRRPAGARSRALFARATDREQRFLRAPPPRRAPAGRARGRVADALARAADVPPADVRRALDARRRPRRGRDGGARRRPRGPRRGSGSSCSGPLKPMLAQTAESPREALERARPCRRSSGSSTARGSRCTGSASEVRAYTRNLADITDRVPEVVAAVLALPVEAVVLDGEAIALEPDGAAAPVPGHDEPVRQQARRRRAPRAGPAVAGLLRLPPRRRRGPPRPAARRAPHRAPGRVSCPRRCGCRRPSDRAARGGRALPRRRDRARPRGRDGEGARRALRGGPPRRGLAEGEARPHARPRRPRGRVGARAPPGKAARTSTSAPAIRSRAAS